MVWVVHANEEAEADIPLIPPEPEVLWEKEYNYYDLADVDRDISESWEEMEVDIGEDDIIIITITRKVD